MTTTGGWEAIREAVWHRVGASAFEAWFQAVEGRTEGDTLILDCPDRFTRDWIRTRYGEILDEFKPEGGSVEYKVGNAEHKKIETGSSRTTGRIAVAAAEPAPRSAPDPCFESFVADPGNVLALEAARAIALDSVGGCSPLVLVGGSGVGKSHLCRAIRRQRRDNVVYRSSEEFTTEVTRAMRTRQMDAFRGRYRRSCNLLILEDVQFLAGKNATQIECFHTLDHLISRGTPVVLSAEKPPQEIEGLDPKLASRMASGLVACIKAPELKTRLAILREKAAAGGVRLPEDCLERLAERRVRSVRDLIAGLNQVVARAALLRHPVDLGIVEEALATVDVPGRRRGLEEILGLVGRSYGLSREELRSRSRRRRIVRPRQMAMYLARHYTDASLKEIGLALGRDHSSVRRMCGSTSAWSVHRGKD